MHSVSLTSCNSKASFTTYREVTTSVMALIVHQVCESSRPASRHREELLREERVSERLVKEGCRRSGRCPLRLIDVLECADVRLRNIDLLLQCLLDEGVLRGWILAVGQFVSSSILKLHFG